MKKILVIMSILLISGCQMWKDFGLQSTSQNENDFSSNPVSTVSGSIQFDDCGPTSKYQNQPFLLNFNKQVADFILNSAYPENLDRSGAGDIVAYVQKDNFVSELCYAETYDTILAAIFYSFQMMGGESYLVRYDIESQKLEPANMENIRKLENFVLFSFGKTFGNFIEIRGETGEGELEKYLAWYDYTKNVVYPKQICEEYDEQGNKTYPCKTFEIPK